MFLSISTWVFANYSLEENFSLPKKLGFKHIEFNPLCVENEADESLHKLRRLLLKNDLVCSSVHSAGFYVKKLSEVEKAVYYGEASIKLASILDSPILVVHSYVSKEANKELRKKIVSFIFSKLYKSSKEAGVELTLENLSPRSKGYGRNLKEVTEVSEILKEITNKRLSLTLDMSHLSEINEAYRYIENFEVKNIHVSSKFHEPLTPIPEEIESFLRYLSEKRYEGPLTIELKPNVELKRIAEFKKEIEKVKRIINE